MAKFAWYFPRSKAVVACCCAGGMVFARLSNPAPPTSPSALSDMMTIDSEGESAPDEPPEENVGSEPSALLELRNSDGLWLEGVIFTACKAIPWKHSDGTDYMENDCASYARGIETNTIAALGLHKMKQLVKIHAFLQQKMCPRCLRRGKTALDLVWFHRAFNRHDNPNFHPAVKRKLWDYLHNANQEQLNFLSLDGLVCESHTQQDCEKKHETEQKCSAQTDDNSSNDHCIHIRST